MKLNKDAIYLGVIILLIGVCGQFYYSYQYLPKHQVSVYYNHDIEANEEVIRVIQDADKFVYFAIYTFTRKDIKDALLGAKHRGLDVRGITDKNQLASLKDQADIIGELRNDDIPITVQDHSALMHIKTVVTDKAYASGSYNWTASATNSNDEVLEVGSDEQIREQYEGVIREVIDKYQ